MQESNFSFVDFSESNTWRPETAVASYSNVSSAVRVLRGWAMHFYNQTDVDRIEGAARFIDRYIDVRRVR